MTRDEVRSARLLFGEELALGEVEPSALDRREVATAVRATPVPSWLSRKLQGRALAGGRLGYLEDSVAPMVAARRAVLGAAADGPPRVLVRVDGFPAPGVPTEAMAALDAILRDAGVPYLVSVLPRVPDGAEDRGHDWEERELLERLRDDAARAGGPVGFGVGGLDGRAKDGREGGSELAGRKRNDLVARLDAADAVLDVAGLPTSVFVAPRDAFEARQYPVLAARYEVVTGGPSSVATMGWHRTPLWRGDAVWLPAHAPLHGPAAGMLETVAKLVERRPAVWVPLRLDLAAEHAAGWDGVRRLAAGLAGVARPWDELVAAVRACRR